MKIHTFIISAATLLLAANLWAQQQPEVRPPQPPDQNQMMPPGDRPPQPPDQMMQQQNPLEDNLFPPELVMQNQRALHLTDEQKTYLKEEMKKAQAQFSDLQWQIQPETEELASLLGKERPDEKAVIAQLEKVSKLELEIKKVQMTLVMRIKSKLTDEQQAQLRELKMRAKHRPPQPQMR